MALAIGLFIGIERERRRKEAGLRTFAFAAVLGAVGRLLGESFALLSLGLVGLLVGCRSRQRGKAKQAGDLVLGMLRW
ncbi:MAG: MgtC/SapB family protein [Candidatus Binatia bacterium]